MIFASDSGHMNIVKYLVEKGADINDKDNDGKNALDFALEKEHSDVIEYLKNL